MRTSKAMSLTRTTLTAAGAILARVTRVHVNNCATFVHGLVVKKLLQLAKRPRMEVGSLFSSLPCALANMGELFQNQRVTGVEVINNTPANRMV